MRYKPEKASIEASKIMTHFDNIMSLPKDEYEDVWEISSLRPTIAVKPTIDGWWGENGASTNQG